MGGGDGGGGTGPEARVPATIQISNTLVTLVEAGETRELTFSVRDQDGVPIINPSASFTSDDENVASVDGSGTVTAVGNGRSMVTVASGAARAAATIDVAIGPAPLEEGVSLSGLSGGPGSERRFTIELPAGGGASELLEVRLHRGTGDADLALRFGEEPALFLSDCATLSDPNVAEELDFCSVFGPASGTWHLLVVGQSSFGGASLDARILTTTPLAEGASVSNLSGSAGDLLYYELDVSGAASPPAQQSLAGSTLRISTSGGSGNLDVFATTESRLSSASLETVPCFSHGDGTTEACEVPDPMTGPWRIALLGREAFSGVSLTATLGEPPATGTITVQKTIESSTGGAPDNPANPPLNGFVFDILEAGTQTVAATVVTDAQGNATGNVPVGSYDVVETNSQGLTDQTGAANGVAVTQGQNTNVPWTNRQVAPATGTITVQKTIESSTGGAPDNPANPPLNGFVFDILEAGTQTVAATVVTDAQGNATDNVPVGSYDVVETNSQGLTDQTGAANGVAVTQGQNTNVPWTNRQVAPATGTITVQKTIESSTGGAPDNPANPPLNGFVFDILEAGTQTVAATVVTDAQGNATDNVPVGSYDVVETNSQGLTDQTGAANGVAVTQGQNTNVPWTNRQVAPATGTITVQKTIESSTGGAPDNPANPPLNGFVFDILEAGTQTVAATVVTDAQGNATDNVPVGSYDVVETNSQGLTDQTGAANGVAVTQGQNTNVPWTNRQVAPATVVIVNLIGNPDDFVFQDPQGSSTTTIQAGTTIRWVRVSGPRHTVTPDGHTEWDEAELTSNGQTFEHTFLTPGTFDYLCDPHRDEGTPANGGNGMRGTIIVQ